MSHASTLFHEFVSTDGADLPLPGSGQTWRRFSSFAHWASKDLSVGRLCEGHGDALAILAEAGMHPKEQATYGVWASRSAVGGTFAERVPGGWRLRGSKSFCSGSGIIERALVTADSKEGYLLFDVAVDEQVTEIVPNSWPAVGMAESMSETLEFGGPIIPDDQLVGWPEFYTRRPGFWFGAAGVAACWYGGAVGLVNSLTEGLAAQPNEHVMADVGEAVVALETMRQVLRVVADAIDDDPRDDGRHAHFQTLVARHVVHDSAEKVLSCVASAGGARPLCHDGDQARRVADLYVYLSQHHGRADAAELGRIVTEGRS
jgi:alkylation response protein AidB-like acyl-CoA dehydrogenase